MRRKPHRGRSNASSWSPSLRNSERSMSRSYNPKVLVGNWHEARLEREYQEQLDKDRPLTMPAQGFVAGPRGSYETSSNELGKTQKEYRGGRYQADMYQSGNWLNYGKFDPSMYQTAYKNEYIAPKNMDVQPPQYGKQELISKDALFVRREERRFSRDNTAK
ncbi:unnamed protein product [Vitrella brassicaformis CCMP3155]|uniref:Uncharacterized protein n=1 Tax=Vitrella brassicaformis (strain CCMP3155) TaxID=1169540 RepID=A0A0G4G262_VITBC|nr:unnamed protein product [Vitrella brassicaformis CCMP3155]|eukprot:CEM22070.1 unnamed protein product [Vitrella brassicaformis CCMP3155]